MPVPVDDPPREYVRIRPTEDPIRKTLDAEFERLHQLCLDTDVGLLDRLRGNADHRTVECLLVADGDPETPITYSFGIVDPDALDALETTLRGVFPDSYEFDRVDHLQSFPARLLGIPGNDDEADPPRAGDPALVAVDYTGNPERGNDWQTRLRSFESLHESDDEDDTQDSISVPLATVAETMANATEPMVYQALLRPKPDWSGQLDERRQDIEMQADTVGDKLLNGLFGTPDPDDDHVTYSASDETRLEELSAKDPRHCFEVTARAVAVATDETERHLEALQTALNPVGKTCYAVEGRHATGDDAVAVARDLCDRRGHSLSSDGLRDRLPGTTSTNPIVADPAEAPTLCLLDGSTLNAEGRRSLSPTPGERTTLPRPPVDQLGRYHGPGLLLGDPLTQDGMPDVDPLRLPPSLQPLHVGWFGKTGSGKSTSLINAMLENHAATDGANILVDPKGDGMALEYIRAHYARYGHAENVVYFDCSSVVPAFSFFDIRDELDAGIARTTAVEDTVDHYIEILRGIMGRDRFEQAVRSPDIIRYLVKAMFDPVHGQDAFSHRELHEEARVMHERQSTKAVSDTDLERMLGGVAANRSRTFDELMQGVANRMEKIPVDKRLGTIFNHVATEDGPHFDLADFLNDDVVVIFDTGALRSEAQRVLTLLILSNLWTALRRRKRRHQDESLADDDETERDSDGDDARSASTDDDLPLVNLYVEEAASVAVSDLLKELLAQSRSFDCSVTLAMQFPGQLRDQHADVYDEVLNNISTFVTGNVPVDKRLTERLATDDMPPQEVGNRLRALERGQWLVNLPAPFGEPEPRPFLVESASPPPGDPEGPRPLRDREQAAFRDAVDAVTERTTAEYGLTLGSPSTAGTDEDADEFAESDVATDSAAHQPTMRVDSALPHTKRLPETVEYDESIHALRCTNCDNRYDPQISGMKRAIGCCGTLDDVEPDDVPICDLNLKLTPEERQASPWSDTQLMFVQAVYNAQQLRYDPLEYDLLYDSMIRLQEYVGIESEAVQDLVDADVLRHDTDHPHRLFTVTPSGRDVIGESYRLGVDYGHGQGDLEESSQHIMAVEIARQYLESEYLDDPESEVVEVTPYYDLKEVSLPASAFMAPDSDESEEVTDAYDQRRLDIAALDDDGEVVVAVEAERVNHDTRRAVPDDFDKIADCDPDEAIWVVTTRQEAHDVLEALNDPLEGEPRVEKTYSQNTPPDHFKIDTPGLTAVYTVDYLRDRIEREGE
ncbi:ATP-binding protein [Halostella sp. JP-L12]|nr:ATP-binding protein [Halostella sp. JP-L12]